MRRIDSARQRSCRDARVETLQRPMLMEIPVEMAACRTSPGRTSIDSSSVMNVAAVLTQYTRCLAETTRRMNQTTTAAPSTTPCYCYIRFGHDRCGESDGSERAFAETPLLPLLHPLYYGICTDDGWRCTHGRCDTITTGTQETPRYQRTHQRRTMSSASVKRR